MKRSKKNIERNKLDYLLTDIMPVEVSELFSFSKFYEYLLSKQSTLDDIVSKMRAMKAENSETPFAGGKWGNWATSPLKFNILKGTDSIRGLNLVQPLSAMNIYFFVECYQKELLDILSNNSCFSLRYHRKNSDLFYRRKSKKIVDYFEKTSQKVDRAILQQTGAYFKIYKFNSVSSFTNSRLWQQCNFKYHNFAKIDYKSCFDSIYTHAYKWCIEKDFIQQALTLVESKMPKEIIEHNFLYCKELFDVTPSGTIIKKSEKEHLNDDNSPKQRWESVENYIFQKFGWTKKDKNRTFFLNLSEIDNLDKIEYYRGYPNCYINPPKKDTAWESRCYRISEHQKEKKDINVLVRLHMELKQIRNQANHAGEDDNRYSIDTVRKALKAYVELYEKIERKLHR